MKYTYNDLVEDLEIGEEIDFRYNGHRYSISTNEKGWYLTKYGNDEYHSFSSIKDLLHKARIDGLTLQKVWDYIE